MPRGMWMKKSYSPAKGILAGMVGGLFASWVMNQFQAGMSKVTRKFGEEEADADRWSGAQGHREHERAAGGEEEASTEKLAVAIAEGVFHTDLEPEEKKSAGSLVHYGYGGLMGALYGWAAESSALTRAGSGALFGAALWFGSDEIGVPMFGLSKGPQEYPISAHASALGAHIVYGVTTELARRALRRGYLAS